jgi:hypothetical protein
MPKRPESKREAALNWWKAQQAGLANLIILIFDLISISETLPCSSQNLKLQAV